MHNFAIIQNGIVDNIVYAQDSFNPEGIQAVLLQDILPVGIGDSYDGTYFYDHQTGELIRNHYEVLQKMYNDLLEQYLDSQLME